ncbi:hypothetical protein NL676_029318 [Syzygium grande]|nr:hypothetical protein NL676_029318 [Syzygium grande]
MDIVLARLFAKAPLGCLLPAVRPELYKELLEVEPKQPQTPLSHVGNIESTTFQFAHSKKQSASVGLSIETLLFLFESGSVYGGGAEEDGGFRSGGKDDPGRIILRISCLGGIPFELLVNGFHSWSLLKCFSGLGFRCHWHDVSFGFDGVLLNVQEMTGASGTRNWLEGWWMGRRSPFDDESGDTGTSAAAGRNWVVELSPIANIVVRRCSKVLGISMSELQQSFDEEACDYVKHPQRYARNFLEFCCFMTLSLSVRATGHLADKKFRQLTYDMMVAWESPAASNLPSLNMVDENVSVGAEAFSRIAPAIPIIANVIICKNLFELLSTSTGGRLQFPVYDKFLSALERAMRRLKSQTDSARLFAVRSLRGEKVLEVDGKITSQPVLEHVGRSTWPGRLTLTDHALYFEAFRVVSYDKAKRYNLSDELEQVIRPEVAGPLGTRLFDKAILYNSVSLSEPVTIEFPELKGHKRRDYWLAIVREILSVHRFINKFQITGIERDEAISKAILGILRVQAIQNMNTSGPFCYEALLMFSLCDQLPGGDLIMEALAKLLCLKESDRQSDSKFGRRMYSMSSVSMISNLGFLSGNSSSHLREEGLPVGEISVGQLSLLERAVKESGDNYKEVVAARESCDGAKVNGIDTNLAVMKELMFPIMAVGNWLLSLAYWDDPLKSSIFCLSFTFIICRGWLGYFTALVLIGIVVFVTLTRLQNQGRPAREIKVMAPPAKKAVEQLLAVHNGISLAEGFIQDGNIILLKLRALLLSSLPQASEKLVLALVVSALIITFLPGKYTALLIFLEIFTRYSPFRRKGTERLTRRLRDWWFSIPAAPVIVEREGEEKKKKSQGKMVKVAVVLKNTRPHAARRKTERRRLAEIVEARLVRAQEIRRIIRRHERQVTAQVRAVAVRGLEAAAAAAAGEAG